MTQTLENTHAHGSSQSVLEQFDLPGIGQLLERRFRRAGIDRIEAQDLRQQCFLILLERLDADTLDDPALADRFLFGVASMLIRARSRGYRALESDEMDRFLSPVSGPDAAFERKQTRHIVESAVDGLPKERDRYLLNQYYFLDEDMDEICEKLRIPTGTAKVALHRARNRLRTLLGAVA